MSYADGRILRPLALAKLEAAKLSIGNWAWLYGDTEGPVAATQGRLQTEMPSVAAELDLGASGRPLGKGAPAGMWCQRPSGLPNNWNWHVAVSNSLKNLVACRALKAGVVLRLEGECLQT